MNLLSPDQLLNAIASPNFGQNARRKWTEKKSDATITAGQNIYTFFQDQLNNPFLRNARFPISGNEVFFVTDIGLYFKGVENEGFGDSQFAIMDEILARCYLLIKVNDRDQIKLPLLEIANFWYAEDIANTNNYKRSKRLRHLLYPIIMNSNAGVSYQIVLNDVVATALDTSLMELRLYGIQFDKLDTFYYDVWKDSKFQRIDYTLYDVHKVETANETTYNLFQNRNALISDYSKFLPLSDIERFDVNAIEFGFFNRAVDITPEALFNNRQNNILQIIVEDVEYFNSYLHDCLTFSQVEDAVTRYYEYQVLTLKVPITLPAKGNVRITLTQPGGSECVEDYFIGTLKGILTRRVV